MRLAKFVINKGKCTPSLSNSFAEKISVNFHTAPSDDWKRDWAANLPNCVDSYEPCFILFRIGSIHDWVLIR